MKLGEEVALYLLTAGRRTQFFSSHIYATSEGSISADVFQQCMQQQPQILLASSIARDQVQHHQLLHFNCWPRFQVGLLVIWLVFLVTQRLILCKTSRALKQKRDPSLPFRFLTTTGSSPSSSRFFTSLSGFDLNSAVEAVDGVVGREGEEAELGQNLLPRAAQIGWPPRFAWIGLQEGRREWVYGLNLAKTYRVLSYCKVGLAKLIHLTQSLSLFCIQIRNGPGHRTIRGEVGKIFWFNLSTLLCKGKALQGDNKSFKRCGNKHEKEKSKIFFICIHSVWWNWKSHFGQNSWIL